MSSIHIRDVNPQVLEALKRLARSHRRSLQKELHVIMDQAARMAPPEVEEEELNLVTVRTGNTGTWSREELYGDQGR